MVPLPDACVARFLTRDDEPVGAGYFVGPRMVVTCAHVVCDALGLNRSIEHRPSTEVKLDFPYVAPGEIFFGRVVVWKPTQLDAAGDIAGLELTRNSPAQCQSGPYSCERVGQRFKVYGVPDGHPTGVWAFGHFGPRLPLNKWIQIEDDKVPGQRVRRGFSGGPAWSETDQCIIGMVVAADVDPTSKTAFVVPHELILAAWPSLSDSVGTLAHPAAAPDAVHQSSLSAAGPGGQNSLAPAVSPEELIMAAATAIENLVVEDIINMIEGRNRAETSRMQKLLRGALKDGSPPEDIRENASAFARALNQFHSHLTQRIEALKARVSFLESSIERCLAILQRPPFPPRPPA